MYNLESILNLKFQFQASNSHTWNLKLQIPNLTSDHNFKCQPYTLETESTSNVNFKSQHWTSAPNFKFKPQRQLQRSFSKSTLNFHSKIQQSQTSTSKSNFDVEHQTSNVADLGKSGLNLDSAGYENLAIDQSKPPLKCEGKMDKYSGDSTSLSEKSQEFLA